MSDICSLVPNARASATADPPPANAGSDRPSGSPRPGARGGRASPNRGPRNWRCNGLYARLRLLRQ
eukprot:3470013-Alexandrium_andersonii.AAC.1